MIVKGQLKDAQLELVSDLTTRDSLPNKAGQVVYVLSTLSAYINNGSEWKTLGSGGGSVGDIKASILTESQYQTRFGSEWIVADGRDITGSDLGDILAAAGEPQNVPDLRGVFLRGVNDGGSSLGARADGNQNPDIAAIGAFTSDKIASHAHSYTRTFSIGSGVQGSEQFFGSREGTQNSYALGNRNATETTVPAGDNETAPKNVTVNYFIKINQDLGV